MSHNTKPCRVRRVWRKASCLFHPISPEIIARQQATNDEVPWLSVAATCNDSSDVLIGMGGDWYCDICNPFNCNPFNCNPFNIASSIMGTQAQPSIVKFIERKRHLKPLTSRSQDNRKIQLSISEIPLCHATHPLWATVLICSISDKDGGIATIVN